jgi:hypothetical protein
MPGRLELSALFPYLAIDDWTVALSQGGFVPMRGSLTDAPAAGLTMSGHGGGLMDAPPRIATA